MNPQAQKNIKEFKKKHGLRGFLILYLKNYFKRVTEEQVRSPIGNDEIIDELKTQISIDDLSEEELDEELENIAEKVVEKIEENKEIKEVIEGKTMEFRLNEEKFYDALHNALEELHNEVDIADT